MASFYLNADGHQDVSQGTYTDQVDGTRPIAKYFAVSLTHMGSQTSDNLFCRVKQISQPPSKKEMDNLFMACLIRNGLVRDKDDRSILTMIDIMALASHNLRTLRHYDLILRTMSWGTGTTGCLDTIFSKCDQPSWTGRKNQPGFTPRRAAQRAAISSTAIDESVRDIQYDSAHTVLVLISCIHYYYSSLWSELHTRYNNAPEFKPDWITASKPVCEKARLRYWTAVNKKAELAKLAGTGASVSEPTPSFTRWRVPVEESDQWECN